MTSVVPRGRGAATAAAGTGVPAAAAAAATAAMAGAAGVTSAATGIEDDVVRRGTFLDCNHTECATTGSTGRASRHFIYAVLAGINGARQAVAAAVRTIDLDTPCWHFVPERSGCLKVDRIPSELDVGVS